MASGIDVIIHEGREKETKALEGNKNRREKSRDVMVDMNARLARVELAMADRIDQFKELGQRIEKLEGGQEELHGDMQGSLNVWWLNHVLTKVRTLKTLLGDINALRSEIVILGKRS